MHEKKSCPNHAELLSVKTSRNLQILIHGNISTVKLCLNVSQPTYSRVLNTGGGGGGGGGLGAY